MQNGIPQIIVAELSHPGEKRTHNEDRYSVTNYRTEIENEPALLAVVADGIGGHQAGEVASQITVDTIVNNLVPASVSDPVAQMHDAVVNAGRVVMQAAQEVEERQGMGSTVAVAWIIGARLYTTSVGDSRIYLAREGRLRQITIDHTWVKEAIDYKIITPEEALDHPQAHVLRRHIGGHELPEPDMRLRLDADESDSHSEANQGLHLRRGDQILLCSDGLTDLVKDDEIFKALQDQSPREAVISLVNLARARGGHDNITVVLLAIPKLPQKTKLRRRTSWIIAAIIGSTALICLTTLAIIAFWWFGIWPGSSGSPALNRTPTSVLAPISDMTSTTTPFYLLTPTLTTTYSQSPIPTITPTPGETSTPFPLPTVAPTDTSEP